MRIEHLCDKTININSIQSCQTKWNKRNCNCNVIYYIKVSGIPSGNKLIKTIWYPHMWRYDILTCEDIIFDNISLFSLQLHENVLVYDQNIVGPCSVIFDNLRKIFGNVRKMSINVCQAFGTILEILQKVIRNLGNLRKFVKNSVISTFI